MINSGYCPCGAGVVGASGVLPNELVRTSSSQVDGLDKVVVTGEPLRHKVIIWVARGTIFMGRLGSRCGHGPRRAERVANGVLQGLDGLDDRGGLARAASKVVGQDPPALELGVGAFPDRPQTGQGDV